MPQPGFHPAMNLVRVVMTNGATYTTRMAWQSPIPRATVYRFLDVDATTHELWTGKAMVEPRVGRAATFHHRFAGAAGNQKTGRKGDGVGAAPMSPLPAAPPTKES
ncbi:hypothetical protein MMPV_008045 [Pyropia vietnamensis]